MTAPPQVVLSCLSAHMWTTCGAEMRGFTHFRAPSNMKCMQKDRSLTVQTALNNVGHLIFKKMKLFIQ